MDRILAIKVFLAASDTWSLDGANQRLGKTQAAVSQAMAALNSVVGASPSSARSSYVGAA